MRKRFSIEVKGDVQGVTFRYAARQLASRLDLSGFARNDPDGSVYLEAEGEDGPLAEFTAWCRRGPAGARVTEVAVKEIPGGGSEGFSIV